MSEQRAERCETCRFWLRMTADMMPGNLPLDCGFCSAWPQIHGDEAAAAASLVAVVTKPVYVCREWQPKPSQ
jgi:hypothetical protein